MAKNNAFGTGLDLPYAVGVGAKSGDPVRVGSINGVCIVDAGVINEWGYPSSDNDASSGNLTDYASVTSRGAWKLPVTITTTDKPAGTPVYAIANGNAAIKKVTLTDVSSGNKLWGHLVKAAKVGAPTQCFVRVIPSSE